MIKVFTTNKDNKIELTKEELENMLNDAYWEGYAKGSNSTYIYKMPDTINVPYTFTCKTNTVGSTDTGSDQSYTHLR